nr:MAG TPA: hypothetical protein [Caudoviricetes sp.]
MLSYLYNNTLYILLSTTFLIILLIIFKSCEF